MTYKEVRELIDEIARYLDQDVNLGKNGDTTRKLFRLFSSHLMDMFAKELPLSIDHKFLPEDIAEHLGNKAVGASTSVRKASNRLNEQLKKIQLSYLSESKFQLKVSSSKELVDFRKGHLNKRVRFFLEVVEGKAFEVTRDKDDLEANFRWIEFLNLVKKKSHFSQWINRPIYLGSFKVCFLISFIAAYPFIFWELLGGLVNYKSVAYAWITFFAVVYPILLFTIIPVLVAFFRQVSIAPIWWTMHALPESSINLRSSSTSRLDCFKRPIKKIIAGQYRADCTGCHKDKRGILTLRMSFWGRKIYAPCSEEPDLHRFSFDRSNEKGKLIS